MERAFGVLQARFAIISNPARLWKNGDLDTIMKACIIIHSMTVGDERDESDMGSYRYHQMHSANPAEAADISRDGSHYSFSSFLERHGHIID